MNAPTNIDELILQHIEAKDALNTAKQDELTLRMLIVKHYQPNDELVKSIHTTDQYSVDIRRSATVSVDLDKKMIHAFGKNNINVDEVFNKKVSYSINKEAYGKLSEKDKYLVDGATTIKYGLATVTIKGI